MFKCFLSFIKLKRLVLGVKLAIDMVLLERSDPTRVQQIFNGTYLLLLDTDIFLRTLQSLIYPYEVLFIGTFSG